MKCRQQGVYRAECGGEMYPYDSPTEWWRCNRCGHMWHDDKAGVRIHRQRLYEKIAAGVPTALRELEIYDELIAKLEETDA